MVQYEEETEGRDVSLVREVLVRSLRRLKKKDDEA